MPGGGETGETSVNHGRTHSSTGVHTQSSRALIQPDFLSHQEITWVPTLFGESLFFIIYFDQ